MFDCERQCRVCREWQLGDTHCPKHELRDSSGRIQLRTHDTDADLGPCPLCGRTMFEDSSDRHHLVPRCRGGVETTHLHRVCHSKLHHTFTEKQLEEEFSTIEALLEHVEVKKFIGWVRNRDPRFCGGNEDTHDRRRRRKR